ncbi:MAG: RraA family protein [Promethearchaeota archaeon]
MGQLSPASILQLQRWPTPAVYNGLEAITKKDRLDLVFNLEACRDFMENLGPMAGYAITVVIEPSNPVHKKENPDAWTRYRRYVASVNGPKIVVVQDLDAPRFVGSFWGEVNGNIHRALGCVGTITDGAIRDVDEMRSIGFKAIARRLCVGHAYNHPVRWGCEVEVFGAKIKPGDLIHADKHGFLVIPEDDQDLILEATSFMDANECNTLIATAKSSIGRSNDKLIEALDDAARRFKENVKNKFKARQ